MTYEKLRSFEKHLPKSFLDRTWQPPQLLDAMKQFDPLADKSFELRYAIEKTPGQPVDPSELKSIGKHRAFPVAWLRKQYNSLGSYLHARRSSAPIDERKLREMLVNVANEIEAAQAESIIGGTMASLIHFKCQLCDEEIVVSEHYVTKEKKAVCLNSACEAEYAAEIIDGRVRFTLRAEDAFCGHCGEKFYVEIRYLKPGLVVKCFHCGGRHLFGNRWLYNAL